MATTTNPLLPLAVREWTEAKRAAAESIIAARRPGVVDWRAGRSWTFRVMHHAQAHAAAVCAQLLAEGNVDLATRYAHAANLLGQRGVRYRPGWEERRTPHPQTCTYHGGCAEPADPTRDDQRCECHAPSRRWP